MVYEMAKEKLITTSQLKKVLKDYTKEELIVLVTEVSASSSQAKEYLTVKFASQEDIITIQDKYKQKITNEFFPKSGFGKLNLKVAKGAIADFKKICSDKALILDLMLVYVENSVEFTATYGDIDSAFYNSAYKVFEHAVDEINNADEAFFLKFANRLETIVETAIQGWNFQGDLEDLYETIPFLHD
jgi:hypothetical protein